MPDALIEAIRSGEMRAVRQAVAADPPAARHPRAVVAAGRRAFQPALAFLLTKGADLNAAWKNYRPLHALLQEEPHGRGAKPTPERLACLEWLLANGADQELTAAWPSARTIIVAAFMGEPEYIKRLRRGGARVDGFAAAALGDLDLLRQTLRKRPPFATERDAGGLTALQCAAGSRMPGAPLVEAAALLLDAGADLAARTRSWAHDADAPSLAASAKNAALFKLLLERGADPTEAFSHPVWGAAYEMAEMALEHGADPDRATANGKPLLNDLIRWGQIPQTLWLLARGASPNIADERGWTAVHQAASRGNLRLLEAVLDAGGDRGRRDRTGDTPLDIAVQGGREKLAARLAV
ncbi:MAG: ankyrin repeat domain-containing protein [Bryobacteraceae bacterium]